jgi:hypothetical protein
MINTLFRQLSSCELAKSHYFLSLRTAGAFFQNYVVTAIEKHQSLVKNRPKAMVVENKNWNF